MKSSVSDGMYPSIVLGTKIVPYIEYTPTRLKKRYIDDLTVVRTNTKIGYASDDELKCSTKYYYTEALDMVYFHDDLFKGSGENGAKQIGDEWELNFSIELNIPFGEISVGYIIMRIKYVGDRYIGYIELHKTNSVE